MSSQTYSGDITLSNHSETPLEVRSPANVHIETDSIDGDLHVVDAEYVFTGQEPTDSADIDDPAEQIEGDIEDVYAEPDGVGGDLVINGAEDVFIEPGAVSGQLVIKGEEQTFRDLEAESNIEREVYDATVSGWQRSQTVTKPESGIAVSGGRCSLTVEHARDTVDIAVTGWNNTIDIEGLDATVNLHLIGSQNTVTAGPYITIEEVVHAGLENDIEYENIPYADLIETSKEEAYSSVTFGRDQIAYQVPAEEESHCPNCGSSSNRIIRRKRKDAFFLFGHPLYTYEQGGDAYECGECSMNAHPDVALTEEERKDIFR